MVAEQRFVVNHWESYFVRHMNGRPAEMQYHAFYAPEDTEYIVVASCENNTFAL